MRVNEKYIRTMYVAFGSKARKEIKGCVVRIIDSLEDMSKEERKDMLENMNPEVRKAIIVD